jgi:hypothetical protein
MTSHELESEERGIRARRQRKGGAPRRAGRAPAEDGMGAGAPSPVGEGPASSAAGWRGWGERAGEEGAEAEGRARR